MPRRFPTLLVISVALAICCVSLLLVSRTAATSATDGETPKREPGRIYATAEMQHQLEQQQRVREATGESKCGSPFGTLLGVANGVPAFSNCNEDTTSRQDSIVQWDPVESKVYYEGDTKPATSEIAARLEKRVSGMRWQCVEYARRYLMEKIGLVFQDVPTAVEIWRFTFLVSPNDPGWKSRTELQRFPNFAKKEDVVVRGGKRPLTVTERMPKVNDIVIWALQKDMPHGHIAVVTEVLPPDHPQCKELGCGTLLTEDEMQALAADVEAKKMEAAGKAGDEHGAPVPPAIGGEGKDTLLSIVRIGEQNYHNKDWPGAKTHSRELHLYRIANTNLIGIKDPDGYRTLGWMRPRTDLGVFKGAYSHAEDGEGIEGVRGLLPPRVRPEDVPEYYKHDDNGGDAGVPRQDL